MRTNIYPSNKSFRTVVLYGGIVIVNGLLFALQIKLPHEYMYLFLSVSILMLITITELFDTRAGLFAIFLTLFGNALQPNIVLALFNIFIAGYYFLIRDLRKLKLTASHQREKHFQSLVDVSLQPMIIKNEHGEVLFASDSIKDLLGIKSKLPLGIKLEEFIHPDDRFGYTSFLATLLAKPNEKKTMELRLKKNDSTYIWTRNEAINLFSHPEVGAIVSSWQDITFQKTTDLQQSEILKNERDARALAEKAVRDRDEFLSIASHELKTPLTTVLLQLQATLRKILTQSLADFSGKDLLSSLQIAEKQSLSLSTLIKDLLNVSLASTGRLSLNPESVDLPLLVDSLVEKYREEIRLSGCTVKVVHKEPSIIGKWDSVRLEQAITNLLMNALKYARGKEINMQTDKSGNNAVFTMSDTGMGISADLQHRIFEPFQRANGDSSIKGLGVGLFITKQIAVSHGGSIEVESKLGKGTTFTLTLPLPTIAEKKQ